MNKSSRTRPPQPLSHRSFTTPAARSAAQEDQYDAGPLTEVVSASLKTAEANRPTGSGADHPVLYRRTHDGVAHMGTGPSAGLVSIADQKEKAWSARTWGLVQARNLYIAYPHKHPDNPKVADACRELKALCNRPDVQRSGLPCDPSLLRLLMVLTAADEEQRVSATPPEYTRPTSPRFHNPLPGIPEAPPTLPKVRALKPDRPPVQARLSEASGQGREAERPLRSKTLERLSRSSRQSTGVKVPPSPTTAAFRGSAVIHRTPKVPHLLTLAEVMAREAADPDQHTVGPMHHVVAAKHERLVAKQIDFEKHPKALCVKVTPDGHATLDIRGRARTPRAIDTPNVDPHPPSEQGRAQLQQLVAIYRRKHRDNPDVKRACDDLRQLCLTAQENRNLFRIDSLHEALKVLYAADQALASPRHTAGDRPPADARRVDVPPIVLPETPPSPRPMKPQPVPQTLRPISVRTTPRTPHGDTGQPVEKPAEPQ